MVGSFPDIHHRLGQNALQSIQTTTTMKKPTVFSRREMAYAFHMRNRKPFDFWRIAEEVVEHLLSDVENVALFLRNLQVNIIANRTKSSKIRPCAKKIFSKSGATLRRATKPRYFHNESIQQNVEISNPKHVEDLHSHCNTETKAKPFKADDYDQVKSSPTFVTINIASESIMPLTCACPVIKTQEAMKSSEMASGTSDSLERTKEIPSSDDAEELLSGNSIELSFISDVTLSPPSECCDSSSSDEVAVESFINEDDNEDDEDLFSSGEIDFLCDSSDNDSTANGWEMVDDHEIFARASYSIGSMLFNQGTRQ